MKKPALHFWNHHNVHTTTILTVISVGLYEILTVDLVSNRAHALDMSVLKCALLGEMWNFIYTPRYLKQAGKVSTRYNIGSLPVQYPCWMDLERSLFDMAKCGITK